MGLWPCWDHLHLVESGVYLPAEGFPPPTSYWKKWVTASYPLYYCKAMKNKAKRLEDPENEVLCKVDVIVFDCECFLCVNSLIVPMPFIVWIGGRSINPFLFCYKVGF